MRGFTVPAAQLATIRVPTVIMNGSKTDPRLQKAAREVAAAIDGAQHVTLTGQTHNVNPAVLTPAIVKCFL
jgi:pimeloyl-ACP methyl ester carboxylesterase